MIVASDVPEVIGTAFALQILSNGAISLISGVLIASCSTMLFLALSYAGRTWLESFIALLVAVISVCFVLECIEGRPDSMKTFSGLVVPDVPEGAENIAVGLLVSLCMYVCVYVHMHMETHTHTYTHTHTHTRMLEGTVVMPHTLCLQSVLVQLY